MAYHPTTVTIAVPDANDYVGLLLDEWDTQLTTWDEAARDAARTRRDLAMTREPMAIIEAETLLAAEGRTEGERRARALLALRQHDGWRGYHEAGRAARERIVEAEHRATLARMRSELVHAALTATLGLEPTNS